MKELLEKYQLALESHQETLSKDAEKAEAELKQAQENRRRAVSRLNLNHELISNIKQALLWEGVPSC
jgi:hypothetical protein